MLPFEHLGPYRLVEPIGRGGMGSVFKAVHVTSGEVVAVKVIATSVSDDMRFRRRFDSEVKTLIKLKHPNIVTLIGCGEEDGALFYSMELVEGESLQQRLRREKRLPWPAVLDIGIDVCNALKHAHNFGVFHRDLKPANLLFAQDGSIKLVDFGIAKLFGSADQTAAGSVLGTADFMAPEQADDGPITPRTDLYALGNVLYACFAGRPPFAGRTLTRVIESLRRETPAPLDLIAPEVPEEIIQLVHALLEKSPEDRPPTALAVMNRMKAIRAGLQRTGAATEIRSSADDKPPGERLSSASEQPTHKPSIAGSPTIAAEDVVSRGTVVPANALTTHEPSSKIDLSAPNTRQDDRVGVTHKSLVEGTLAPGDTPTTAPGADSTGDFATQEKRQTHFRTVHEGERRKGIWETEQESSPGRWTHILSVAAMVAALLGAAGLFYWSMQRPSADELYAAILASRDGEDIDGFRSQLDQFKRLYPDDDRIAELEPYLHEVDSGRIMRRLRLAAVRDGGEEQLAPHEQAFLEAMRAVDRDPARAQTMLRHWLDVYSPPQEVAAAVGADSEDGLGSAADPAVERPGLGGVAKVLRTPDLPSIARAAKQEWLRLSATAPPPGDVRAEELIERIEWANQNLDATDLQRMLAGIVSLYQDKEWAQPAVDLARARLRELPLRSDR
ncbi:MAG: serine/threonine-protein kinase [Planctomycetaceae bacterium]